MTITIIGTGFVGVVSSAVFSSFGNKVYGLDVDQKKIDSLSNGIVPFFEPKLEGMVADGIKSGNLIFTTDYMKAISESDVVIVAVGTPSAPDGTADLKYVLAACESMAPYLKNQAIVAIKSTVPPGSFEKIRPVLENSTKVEFELVSLPEFLREGSAVDDTLHADRVVIGANTEFAVESLLKLHEPITGERVVVSPESAQMAKYAANSYLALRITFINQIADICEHTNANVEDVIRAIGPDKRIGKHYWYPGLGYGGSCFPKDVKELASLSRRLQMSTNLIVKIDELNETRIEQKLIDFDRQVGGFSGKNVAILGLSFKPNTTDMRVAPSLSVIPWLKNKGAIIKAYDPKAIDEAKKVWDKLFYGNNLEETLMGADVVMLLVEWDEFVNIQFSEIKHLLRENAVIIDTRNVYSKAAVEAAGLKYIGIGNS